MNRSNSGQCITYIGRFALIILLTFVIVRIMFITHEKSSEIEPESLKNYPPVLRTATVPISKNEDRYSSNTVIKTLKFNASYVKSRNRTANDARAKRSRNRTVTLEAYRDDENVISPSRIVWENFIATKMEPKRTSLNIPTSVLSTFSSCPKPTDSISANKSQITTVKKGCTEIWSDSYISSWKKRLVPGLCEENANSKIKCFDSTQSKSRFCIFENAMMNFRKVRKRKVEGNVIRSWERGFLSADCGDMAPDDIGYLPLYKPDIEGRENAICDYTFNETVLLFSHENARNFHSMAMDYLSVWMTIWAAGLSKYTHDITLLNMDGLRNKGSGGHGRYYGDIINQFFLPYNTTFRRILRAVNFADNSARICFKQLIVQPRPSLPFHAWDGGEDPTCPALSASSLFQRFNLQLRHSMGLLPSPHASDSSSKTGEGMQILLVLRSLKPGQSGDQAISRIFRHQTQLIAGLQQWIGQNKAKWPVPVVLIAQDLIALSYEDQLRLISQSSVVVGMHGAGIAAASLMMPVGNKLCCGLVEIVPTAVFPAARGYVHFAKRMGHVYERLLIAGNTSLATADGVEEVGSEVTVDEISEAITRVIARILDDKGSCMLEEVLQVPYL